MSLILNVSVFMSLITWKFLTDCPLVNFSIISASFVDYSWTLCTSISKFYWILTLLQKFDLTFPWFPDWMLTFSCILKNILIMIKYALLGIYSKLKKKYFRSELQFLTKIWKNFLIKWIFKEKYKVNNKFYWKYFQIFKKSSF